MTNLIWSFMIWGLGGADSQAPPIGDYGEHGSLVPKICLNFQSIYWSVWEACWFLSLFKIELVCQESARWFSCINPLSGWKAEGSTTPYQLFGGGDL